MFVPDVTPEIVFRTARSGGKGGQNVNKVETMVEGLWHVANSAIVTEEQKDRISEKLAKKINQNGYLLVKSQADRTQLGNKKRVIKKIHFLIEEALQQDKPRKKSKPGKAAVEKRLFQKKKRSELKGIRRRRAEE